MRESFLCHPNTQPCSTSTSNWERPGIRDESAFDRGFCPLALHDIAEALKPIKHDWSNAIDHQEHEEIQMSAPEVLGVVIFG